MANVRNSNTYYVDTTTTLAVKGLRVSHVTVTATGANAVLVLKDVTTGNAKADLRVAASGASQVFNYSENPIFFPNGIDPATVTNCVATLNLLEVRG